VPKTIWDSDVARSFLLTVLVFHAVLHRRTALREFIVAADALELDSSVEEWDIAGLWDLWWDYSAIGRTTSLNTRALPREWQVIGRRCVGNTGALETWASKYLNGTGYGRMVTGTTALLYRTGGCPSVRTSLEKFLAPFVPDSTMRRDLVSIATGSGSVPRPVRAEIEAQLRSGGLRKRTWASLSLWAHAWAGVRIFGEVTMIELTRQMDGGKVSTRTHGRFLADISAAFKPFDQALGHIRKRGRPRKIG